MSSIEHLRQLEDLDIMLELSKEQPLLLLKHSNLCAISAMGLREFKTLRGGDTPLYQVTVQEARPLSDAIAEKLGVRHQSPQAIFIGNAEATGTLSHHHITQKALKQLVAGEKHD